MPQKTNYSFLYHFRRLYYYSPLVVIILLTRASLDPLLGMVSFGPFTAGAILNLLMLLIMLTILINTQFKTDKSVLLWLPLIMVTLVSLTYTTSQVSAVKSTLVLITYIAVFLIPFHFIKSEMHFVECLKLIVYSAVIPLLASTYEFVFPDGSTNIYGFRLFSTFSHPNIFAFYLVTVISVCFFAIKSALFYSEIAFKKHCYFILFFSLICLLLTKTRSAWAVIAFLVLLYGLLEEKKYILYLLLAMTLALFVPSIQERVFDLLQGNDPDAFLNDYERLNSFAWRQIIWAGAIEKFWEKPILGFGFESFTDFSGAFFLIQSEVGAGSHNTYVQVLFELGVVGLIAFLFLLIKLGMTIWQYRKQARENTIVLGLFLSYCLVHYSDNIFDYLVFNWYFWFFIGAFLAFSKIRMISQLKSSRRQFRSSSPRQILSENF